MAAVCTFSAVLPQNLAASPDVTGSWKWEAGRPGGETRTYTANLKQDGTKVTGTIAGPRGRKLQIQEGKIAEDGTLSFVAKFERNDRSFTLNYKGKVAEDKITGQTSFTTRSGETRSRDWVATREAGKATGKWKTVRERDNGRTFEFVYDLKQQGNTLSGTTSWNGRGELKIQNGTVRGEDIAFKVVRERDGRTLTTSYKGKLQGDKIVGTVAVDWGEGAREFDWEATRVK